MARVAGVLAGLGVGSGDRVLIYMPMVPEAVIAMLACARIGAIHSVVFGGFAAHELATRIDDARPRVILTASCGIEVGPGHRRTSRCSTRRSPRRGTSRERCVVLQRPMCRAELVPGRDHDWEELEAGAAPGRLRAGRWRPIRSTSSTPRARPATRKASCATTAATRSRSPGACATSTASSRARCSGPPRTSAGSSATRTSSTGRCSTAAPRSCTRASRSARPMPARSGG